MCPLGLSGLNCTIQTPDVYIPPVNHSLTRPLIGQLPRTLSVNVSLRRSTDTTSTVAFRVVELDKHVTAGTYELLKPFRN